ncbi:ubiquitin-like-specific protease 1A isoform X2 [Rosa chinensis]|uniref:ubiquitin-like-specific protease 1A isoform X2 n=1 Tax=Rosa chinensis TaxID=74649 RepID=UPI001AD933D8|nr:ubiquitin-like-specific protease 1A isoform X2 [Rosa chinensis]
MKLLSCFRIFQTDYEHLDRLAMKCLELGRLVTSEIINAAVSLLRDLESSTWYYTTCFSDRAIKAAKKGGNDLLEFAATAPKRFAAILQYRKGLKNGEKIFIPILDPDTTPNHWFFIVIKLARTDVEIWDTYPNPARTMAQNDLVSYVLLALDTIFDTEIQSCFKKGWSFCSFTVFNVNDIDIQQNNFDCGIFMLRYIINYDNPLKDEVHLRWRGY